MMMIGQNSETGTYLVFTVYAAINKPLDAEVFKAFTIDASWVTGSE